jgi:PAS domain S-box-containing protein
MLIPVSLPLDTPSQPHDLEQLKAQLAAATRRAEEAERRIASQELEAGAELLTLATDELHRSERMLRAIFGGATDAMLLLDDDGAFVDVNPAACALLKLGKPALLRCTVGDFDDDGPEASQKMFARMKEAGQLHVRGHLRRADGERRAVDMAAVANVGVGMHLVVVRDVTEEYAAAESLAWTEEELRRSDTRFRAMVEKSAEAIALLSADGRIEYITRHSHDLFGMTPAQMVGSSAVTWVMAEDRARVSEALSSSVATGTQVEFRIVDHREQTRWFDAVVTNLLSDPAIAAIVLNARDVTARHLEARERERLIDTLTFERRRLGRLLQQAPALIAVLRGLDLVFEVANDAFVDLMGQRRELIGKPLREALPDIAAQGFVEVCLEVMRTGVPWSKKAGAVSIARKGPELEKHYAKAIVEPLVEADGTVSGVFVIGVDVTEEYAAHQRLRDQFNGVPVPIYAWQRVVVDGQVDFVLRDFNNAARARAEGTLDALRGASLRQRFSGDGVFEDLVRCLDRGEIFQRELDRASVPQAAPRRLLVTYSPAPPDVVLAHAEDITDKRKLEAQLRQAHKMEAVGRLAGGVAHDFNNLLSVVLSYTSLALEELPEGEPIREDLEQVKHAGYRAVELTRQLLAFSRQQVLQPRSMSIRDTVLGLEKMLRRLLGEDVDLVFEMKSRGQVEADPGQMEQVIMNLVINARDAMPEGGTITIATTDIARGETLVTEPPSVATAPLVCLCVSDTGSGMDEATRQQIFEPFFTTKGAGKGTGLGLATVFGIVEQTGGTIGVQSLQGADSQTTFRIYLPRSGRADETFSAAPKVGPARGGHETILVVEDEAPLRALTVTVLRRAGYDILEASDGAEALRVVAETARPIHLLLTDVVMPRMNGRSLADRLAADRPTLKILFMSGYTDDAAVLQRVLASRVAFLQKPLTPEVLLHKIREVLDDEPS